MKSTGTIIFVKENVHCSPLKLQVSRVSSSRKLNILAYVLFLVQQILSVELKCGRYLK